MIRGMIGISRSSRLVSSRTAQYVAVMYNGRILKLSVPPTDFTCIESSKLHQFNLFPKNAGKLALARVSLQDTANQRWNAQDWSYPRREKNSWRTLLLYPRVGRKGRPCYSRTDIKH